MTKKSLFFGTAALALLVLLTVAGCSNPSSGESTTYVTQAASDYPYPADTVFVADRAALDGLLNDINAETNHVRNIGFRGDYDQLATDLIIPAGKTVYLTGDYTTSGTVAGNITVREGAKLVLVSPFVAGNPGLLLVKGQVEVFRGLAVTSSARDVADYTVENTIEPGRNTVIGKNVTILPDAYLALVGGGTDSDIIPPDQNSPNKFTPAQAWAAAGQGHLAIAPALTAYPYTVKELLTGVNPTAAREYWVESGRYTTEVLPAVIPLGAHITTSAIPESSDGNPFIVEGFLATAGTLNSISKIEVRNGGVLRLTAPSGELLTGLTELKLGPGATFAVDDANGTTPLNDDVSLKALETLFLGDGSTIYVPGSVTFKMVEPPATAVPLALTMGKDVSYRVEMSPSATVNTVISEDSGLAVGSELIIYPGSTFTVKEGITFTVGAGANFDVSKLTPPATDGASPVTIDGAIEIAAGGRFIGPDFATVQADPATLLKSVVLGDNGKLVLDHSANFYFGDVNGKKYVGASPATYAWTSGSTAGGEIEINNSGLIIRDTNDINTEVKVTVAEEGAAILKGQSLTLGRGVILTVADTFAFYLFGDADTNGKGAKLLGPGTLKAGSTEITGGDHGWQAIGDGWSFEIAPGGVTAVMKKYPAVATTPPAGGITLKALGLGATITQNATATASLNELTIDVDTTIDLGGTAQKKAGEIILKGAVSGTFDNPGKITLKKVLTTIGTITTGNTAASPPAVGALTAVGVVTDITAATPLIQIVDLIGTGNAAGTQVTTTAAKDGSKLPPGYLVDLKPGTGNSTITGGATPDNAGRISAETPTVADNT
jgi:hypothetical protein